MKIHLGCGSKIIEGFVNCDSRKLPGVDKVFDMEKFPWPFEDGSISYVYTVETLEHLSWTIQKQIFREFYRILKDVGQVSMTVPNIGQMCKDYVDGAICECVPHKSKTDEFKANPNCKNCNGKGRVNPTRWIMAFCGAQKHPWDFHKTMFTKEFLEETCAKANLKVAKYEDHPYKLKAFLEKKLIDNKDKESQL